MKLQLMLIVSLLTLNACVSVQKGTSAGSGASPVGSGDEKKLSPKGMDADGRPVYEMTTPRPKKIRHYL